MEQHYHQLRQLRHFADRGDYAKTEFRLTLNIGQLDELKKTFQTLQNFTKLPRPDIRYVVLPTNIEISNILHDPPMTPLNTK